MRLTLPGKSVFDPPKPKLPEVPKPDTKMVQDTSDELRKRMATRTGRRGTIFTSPLGAVGDEAQIARPTLLGGGGGGTA